MVDNDHSHRPTNIIISCCTRKKRPGEGRSKLNLNLLWAQQQDQGEQTTAVLYSRRS
ncbi:MAG: hypothetical protein AVDCRST_MAG93-1112 [uncultured Chloroflexia bacterium]|uniref:Uncharacterized protein n=1 Tax=uncultured Chloroflexia bacterium TaxID=1672391 RepID=A0A6J4HXH3_9CHLR|nr:MAG: hypothetical protein AVDCRST_MAG93-1112 [uncultured Chloroflexia bacterium]